MQVTRPMERAIFGENEETIGATTAEKLEGTSDGVVTDPPLFLLHTSPLFTLFLHPYFTHFLPHYSRFAPLNPVTCKHYSAKRKMTVRCKSWRRPKKCWSSRSPKSGWGDAFPHGYRVIAPMERTWSKDRMSVAVCLFSTVLQFSAMAFAASVRLFSGPNQQRTFPSFIT